MFIGRLSNDINGIGKINVSNTKTGSVSNGSETATSDSFAGLMNLTNQNIDADYSNVVKDKEKPSGQVLKPTFAGSGKQINSDETVQPKRDDRKFDSDDLKEKKETGLVDNKKPQKSDEVSKTNTEKKSPGVKETTQQNTEKEESVDKAQKELADKIMQMLGIDERELQQLLAETGVSMQDLLNPDNLQQFILQVNDASTVDLLIDEELNRVVKDLLQSLDDILANNGILPEDLSELEASEQTIMQDVTFAEEVHSEKGQTAEETGLSNGSTIENSNLETNRDKDVNHTEPKVSVQTESAGQMENTDQAGNQTGAQSGQPQQNTEVIYSNLNNAVSQSLGADVVEGTTFSDQVSQADILRQIVDEIKVSMSKDVNSITVSLNPEQLGKVQIHVVTKNGIMQAQIIAENEAAKNAVEAGISALREAFENQDLKVDAIEVMVGTQDFFAQSQGETQADAQNEKSGNTSKSINLNDISDDELSESEHLEVEMMRMTGNSVNYMA